MVLQLYSENIVLLNTTTDKVKTIQSTHPFNLTMVPVLKMRKGFLRLNGKPIHDRSKPRGFHSFPLATKFLAIDAESNRGL